MRALISIISMEILITVASIVNVAQAALGGWAPEGVLGSQDAGAPGFVYRAPINKTANITGPVPSNKWWAGVLVKDDIITMSPYPLIVSPCKNRFPAENGFFGLGISYKGPGYVMASGGGPVIGYSKKNWKIASYVHNDLIVMNENFEHSSLKTRVDGYGDWHVNLKTSDDYGHSMNSTITAGSPYIFLNYEKGQPKINLNSFAGNISFYDKEGNSIMQPTTSNDFNNFNNFKFLPFPLVNTNYQGDHIIVKLLHPITQEPRWYGFFAEPNTNWNREGTKLSVSFAANTTDSSKYLIIALIPSLEDAQLFYEHAYNKITGTMADYFYDEDSATVTTTFKITTIPLRKIESVQKTKTRPTTTTTLSSLPLFTLFPHQYKNLDKNFDEKYTNYENLYYKTMRGNLKLFAGNTFKTVLKNHGILHSFNEPTASSSYNHHLAVDYLNKEQAIKDNYNVDTYGGGKALLRIAESINIADKLGADASEIKSEFINSLYNEFANWFTYSPGQEDTFWADGGPHHFFTYFSPENGYWGHLTGWRAGFGTQALNDMHFHFGYWIHAAAILAQYHPTFVQDYGWAIDQIVRNIASPYRDDKKFPYLRYFSPYSGRSYANGWSWDDNHSGNDQESTSEAMNAWASVYLWGLVTGNKTYRDLGLYLYWTEKSAIDQYWFNVDKDILHESYAYSHAVILRETAYEFETFWGSRYIEELFGIQMLPITAATLYLGINQTYANKYWNEMWSIHQQLYGINADFNAWDAIMLRFLALINPQLAVDKFQFGKIHGPLGGQESAILDQETWTSTYFFIHNLNQLGTPVHNVFADKPSFGVFKKNDQYTFVGYNPSSSEALTINFKDDQKKIIYTMKNIPPKTTIYSK
ncbi:MAG: hypothetical protein HQK51_10115 [Oligoflexia bacterium]|nr:hypothetical protein [Oligoflexia bacterium]